MDPVTWQFRSPLGYTAPIRRVEKGVRMGKEAIRFGTDGWRGIMCDDFIVANVELVAQAIAEYVTSSTSGQPTLIVGHDTRFFAEQFATSCARVLAGNGVRVLMAKRPLPTPVTAFAIGSCGADGAVMLTASHNPPVYNGIKFIPSYGGPANPQITGEIEAAIARLDYGDVRVAGEEDLPPGTFDPVDAYASKIADLVDFGAIRRAKLSVVLDVMHGAGQGIMRALLADAGCSVKAIHENRDAFFGGSMPEPTGENLGELIEMVARESADVGLALDGDADRFGVVDRTGTLLTSNQVLVVLALHLLRRRRMRGRIVRTVATTHLLDVVAAAHGVACVETPVGFKYVAAEMLAGDVLIGGEESGGLSIAGHIPEKDGLLADLLMCEVASIGPSLARILADIYNEFGLRITRRIDVHYPSEAKDELLSRLGERPPPAVGDIPVCDVRTTDGVKYLLDRDAWVLIRPSGTEPVVRAYIEARDESDFSTIRTWTQEQLTIG